MKTAVTDICALAGHELVLGYQRTTVVHGVVRAAEPGVVTALVGPNGSGKSTVLRSLARLHRVGRAASAWVTPDDAVDAAAAVRPRVRPPGHPAVPVAAAPVGAGGARRRGLRPAPAPAPVRRRSPTPTGRAIDRAMTLTGVTDDGRPRASTSSPAASCSGSGWPPAWPRRPTSLLLDEPTNHLDLRYQVETLDLVRDLADEHGTALGVVLHDLNHAAAVADQVVLLHQGRVHAAGTPVDVLTAEHLSEVYGLPIDVADRPRDRAPCARASPRARHHPAAPMTSTGQRAAHRTSDGHR